MTNITNLEIETKLLETNFEKPILEFYDGFFTDCFIILHPFYKEVFSQDYDEYQNFRLTYPLIERITWSEILKQTGIKNIKQLALTITYPANNKTYKKKVDSERNEFLPLLAFNHFIEPFWASDKIPEDILIPFFEHLLQEGYSEIKIGHWPEFSDENVTKRKLSNETKFDDAVEFASKNYIFTPDKKYCLKLTYHDLPYTFLLTNGVETSELATKLNYEGFRADNKTKTYWYVES